MAKKSILTITGSDSTGESGIQADIQNITTLGASAVSVVTTITLQNTLGIQDFYDLPAEIVRGQLDAIINDVQPEVIKIGMIRSADTLHAIADGIRKYQPKAIVYAPVLYSARGDRLMGNELIVLARKKLFPLCTAIVLRRRESELLLKDYVGGNAFFLDDNSEHGLVNGFSSALAVYLSQGPSLEQALEKAKEFASRITVSGTKLKGRSGELYSEFLRQLAQDYNVNSDVAHYADKLNVSSRYLAQVCRQIAGKSPKSIIDGYIVKAIGTSLITSHDTIQQIAEKYNFTSQAHLSKYFRNLTGMSPTEYRSSKL